jgi:hypothetical protein
MPNLNNRWAKSPQGDCRTGEEKIRCIVSRSKSLPAQLLNAHWFAHRFVEGADAFRLRHLTRAQIDKATFLTDENIGRDAGGVDVPVEMILGELPQRPLGIVFHSAFCGSTLLTKALSRPGVAIGFSEPVIFNDLVGWRLRGSGGAAIARSADAGMRLMARPFGPKETVIVKLSNLANPLAELLLALNPKAKAIFLYAPLDTFLISVARKGVACRAWVRTLAERYLPLGMFEPLSLTPADLFLQTDLQLAASCWLAQHLLFARLMAKIGPARLRPLNAEVMLGDTVSAIMMVAHQFDLGLRPGDTDKIAAGEAFGRHSKDGTAFSAVDRNNQYSIARQAYAGEIDIIITWAEEFARQLELPGEFLGCIV